MRQWTLLLVGKAWQFFPPSLFFHQIKLGLKTAPKSALSNTFTVSDVTFEQ